MNKHLLTLLFTLTIAFGFAGPVHNGMIPKHLKKRPYYNQTTKGTSQRCLRYPYAHKNNRESWRHFPRKIKSNKFE